MKEKSGSNRLGRNPLAKSSSKAGKASKTARTKGTQAAPQTKKTRKNRKATPAPVTGLSQIKNLLVSLSKSVCRARKKATEALNARRA